jgi:glutamate-1-semialdehyde aminotransferase
VTESEQRYAASLRLWAEGERLIPGGSQTNSKRPGAYAFGAYPIYAARAEGARIWDVDGNVYLDYVNALGPVSLGYCHPAVDGAIREQLERGIISGLLWPVEVEVARGLVEAVPGAEAVRFFKGGGEATAAAARIARAHTGRHLILNAGYRGWPDTWAAGRDPAVPPALAPYVLDFRHDSLDGLRTLLERHAGEVAAVFMDVPYDGPLPEGHLAAVRDLAHGAGALFVLDEIVGGFRLAVGGGGAYYGVVPDLAVFAKGMANGMPLAAVVGRREVMAAAERSLISLTYGGEALSLAAAAAVLRVYREQDVLGHLWTVGRRLMEGLDAAAREAGVPFRCAGYPPMAAMRLDVPADEVGPAWRALLAGCARRGVLLRRGGLNFVTLAHTAADVDETVAACAGAFRDLRAAGYEGAPGGAPAADDGGRGQQVVPTGAPSSGPPTGRPAGR